MAEEDLVVQQPEMVRYFGKHIILDFFGCNQEAIHNQDIVHQFMRDAVKLVGMQIISGPFTQYYTHPSDPGESGVSSLVLLAESHASFHGMTRSGLVCMDLFSCKDFNDQDLIDLFVKTFSPQSMQYTPLNRARDYGHEKYGTDGNPTNLGHKPPKEKKKGKLRRMSDTHLE